MLKSTFRLGVVPPVTKSGAVGVLYTRYHCCLHRRYSTRDKFNTSVWMKDDSADENGTEFVSVLLDGERLSLP